MISDPRSRRSTSWHLGPEGEDWAPSPVNPNPAPRITVFGARYEIDRWTLTAAGREQAERLERQVARDLEQKVVDGLDAAGCLPVWRQGFVEEAAAYPQTTVRLEVEGEPVDPPSTRVEIERNRRFVSEHFGVPPLRPPLESLTEGVLAFGLSAEQAAAHWSDVSAVVGFNATSAAELASQLTRIGADHEPAFTPEADARAEKLLLRHLSPAQRESYRQRGCFEVQGGVTANRYRILNKRQINTHDLTRRRRLCLLFPTVPLADQLVGQKLLLEADEMAFVRDAVDQGGI